MDEVDDAPSVIALDRFLQDTGREQGGIVGRCPHPGEYGHAQGSELVDRDRFHIAVPAHHWPYGRD